MEDKRKRPRWLQRFRAFIGGYFWLPCSICGKDYGGHEVSGTLMLSNHHGICVCANCVEEANKRNEQFYEKIRNIS